MRGESRDFGPCVLVLHARFLRRRLLSKLYCRYNTQSTPMLQLTMGTPAKRLSLSRNSCSRHASCTAGDTVSLKFPHVGFRLLSLFSKENDSPRCAGGAKGR